MITSKLKWSVALLLSLGLQICGASKVRLPQKVTIGRGGRGPAHALAAEELRDSLL